MTDADKSLHSQHNVEPDFHRIELEHQVASMTSQIEELEKMYHDVSFYRRQAASLYYSLRFQLGSCFIDSLKNPLHLFKNIAGFVSFLRRKNTFPHELRPHTADLYAAEVSAANTTANTIAYQTDIAKDTIDQYLATDDEINAAHAQGKTVWVIKCPASFPFRMTWGDFHFALSLKKALEQRNQLVELHFQENWDRVIRADVVLVLRGLVPYHPDPNSNQLHIMWNISHPELITDDEYNEFDAVFIASNFYADILSKRLHTRVYPLLQCTDTSLFYETEEEEKADRLGLIFVGNSRSEGRPCVNWAAGSNQDLRIYGAGWEYHLFDAWKFIKGLSLDNKDIRAQFVACRATLNQHWASMIAYQFVNNRIYDALACGLPVISDSFDELKDLFPDELLYYHDKQSFQECLRRLDEDYVNIKKKTSAVKERIKAEFSFDARADELIRRTQELKQHK